MGELHLGNSDAAATFSTEHPFVFDHSFGDVSLTNRSPHNAACVPCGNPFESARGRDVCDDRAGLLFKPDVRCQHDSHLFREWLATLSHDSETFAVSVMSKTNISVTGFNYRTKLSHRFRFRFG